MSLKPTPIPPVPEEPARVARAIFPKSRVVMPLRERLGSLSTADQFAALFPTPGQPAEAPWRLALVTVLQLMERLTDRQAADAVRRGVAWKYCLSLDLTAPGFDHTVRSEVRTRLGAGQAELRLLELFLERWREAGRILARGRQRTDSTQVLAKVRALHRLLCVAQTLVYGLNVLAQVAPAWVRAWVPADWVER